MMTVVDELAELLINDNAALFIEEGWPHLSDQASLMEQVTANLAARIPYQLDDNGFANVAQKFEILHDRQKLIRLICEALEMLKDQPAPFYQLVADVARPRTKIMTTQFDHRLETALTRRHKKWTAIRRDTDVPFFDETRITLIKMQGDLDDPASLVLTRDDMARFIENLSAISDVIRAFFATKTLIFIGRDLSHPLFTAFYDHVIQRLKSFSRPAYAILPPPVSNLTRLEWRDKNLNIHAYEPLAFLEALARIINSRTNMPGFLKPDKTRPARQPLPPQPYKGLDSFTAKDTAIFAGRSEESHRLANRILAHPLTVFYGESGSGKTSLLHAGVKPLLAAQQVRLAACVPAPGQPLLELMHHSLATLDEPAGLPPANPTGLPALIRAWQRISDRPIVLAVDSFEQVFLAYSAVEREAVLNDLRDLLTEADLNLRLVLVVREDFLGRLESLTPHLPTLLDVRFRLERLGREAARAAIEVPARAFRLTWEPVLVEKLLDDLSENSGGGITPPQLQLVCDYLYHEFNPPDSVEQANRHITLDQFNQAGGTAAILGKYLDRVVSTFSLEQQVVVRLLLGALVSSSGIKQRLALPELVRAAELEPQEAVALLDRLTAQRLLQRYEVTTEKLQAGRVQLEYELIHDYLATRIAAWLGDEFWQRQRAREIVRLALPDWHRRRRLLSPDDLRLVTVQRNHIRFSPEELELIYAAAVSYDYEPAAWLPYLPQATRRRVLLQLLQHTEVFVRHRAARHLAAVPRANVSVALAQLALSDPAAEVRAAAIQAIAALTGSDERMAAHIALTYLIGGLNSVDQQRAYRALVAVRDLEPFSQVFLPGNLRFSIQTHVWLRRWQRHRPHILTTMLRGVSGGFIGGMALVGLFLAEEVRELNREAIVATVLIGLFTTGLLGALVAGGGALATAMLQSLQDYDRAWRTWLVMTLITVSLLGAGFTVLTSLGQAGARQPAELLGGGLLLGLGLTSMAAAPLKLAQSFQLILSILSSMAMFWVVGLMVLALGHDAWWLLPMGAAAGISFFWALQGGAR